MPHNFYFFLGVGGYYTEHICKAAHMEDKLAENHLSIYGECHWMHLSRKLMEHMLIVVLEENA